MALTTAYAGSADITPENAKALLNDALPDDLGYVYIPTHIPRMRKGLKTVVAWLESEVGEDGTIPVDNLVEALVDRRDNEYDHPDGSVGTDEVRLFMVFDPDSEDDSTLALAAHDAGIRVVNLAAAGDDLVFEDEAEPETPPFETEEPGVSAEDVAMAAQHADRQPETTVMFDQGGLVLHLHLDGAGVQALADAIVMRMASLGAQQVAAHSGQVSAETAVVTADSDKPAEPAGRTEQVPGTKPFYYNSGKGSYRPARGILKDGETKVFLTGDEEAAARKANMFG